MMVQLRIHGPAQRGDPIGERWLDAELARSNPGPEWVDVDEVVSERSDGTLDLRIGDPAKSGRFLYGVVEGVDVGQFRRLGAVGHGELRALKQALAPLLQDADPAIRTATEAIATLFGRGGRKNVVQALTSTATNTKRPVALRVQALTLLGVLLAQEIDR